MKYLDKLLEVYHTDRNFVQIIFWWELRRLLYNLIVLICGMASLGLITAIANVPPGEDVEEPLAVVGFAIFCNLGYTLGWVTELFAKPSVTYAPRMFKIGLGLTLFLVFLPLAIHIICWICRGFGLM